MTSSESRVPAGLTPTSPQHLAQLRAALLAEPDAMDRIAGIAARQDGLVALAAFAEARGLTQCPDRLNLALTPDPLGLERLEQRPVNAHLRPGPQWLPVALGSDGAQMTVDWAWFGDKVGQSPFFADEVNRARARLMTSLFACRTPLGALLEEPVAQAAPRLDGLIYHMSRCGSTLVTQVLRAVPGTVAMSEPSPFDEMVTFCAHRQDIALETRIALLRAMTAILTSPCGMAVRRRFIKADCWHVGVLPLLRAAFPETPWLYLFREPVDVLLSQQRMGGMHTFPGEHTQLLGLDDPQTLPGLGFAAQVVAATCEKAAEHAGVGGGLFVDYADFPGAITSRILPHFGVALAPEDQAAVDRALARDAKQPGLAFDPATRTPRSEASAEVLALAETWLAAPMRRLRALSAAVAD